MPKQYLLKELCGSIGAELHGRGDLVVESLSVDSRSIMSAVAPLFIALPGEQHDGHNYIDELYQDGIRAFLVSRELEWSRYPEAGFCMVRDSIGGLHALAAMKRKAFPGTVTAICGSNGKTIIKEWIYHCLKDEYKVQRSPRSYNSQVGVPLSLWMLEPEYQIGVIEAGISKPGEMEKLERIIRPQTGLFTNLGPAHQENFLDLEEKLREKLILFRSCEKVIFRKQKNPGKPEISKYLDQTKTRLISWSTDTKADYNYRLEENREGSVEVVVKAQGHDFSLSLPFTDQASIENALHVLTYCLESGLNWVVVKDRMKSLEPVSMRLEMLKGVRNSILINDSYNSDIAGLSAALDVLDRQDPGKKKMLVLSDMFQSGRTDSILYKEIADLIYRKGVEAFIGIGETLISQRDRFPGTSRFFTDVDSFLAKMDPTWFFDALVLIKGSRSFQFERIAHALQLRTHQTLLEIDQNAMIQNLNYYRSRLKPGVRTMVMVKALSYGSGSEEIAALLQHHRADYLAVAYIDEGLELRKSGIHLPIMVMNPDPAGYGIMTDHMLEPELFSFEGLEALHKVLHYRGVSEYPVHIKLDTGMHRLGFCPEEIGRLLPMLDRRSMKIASVFTHLAASDDPGQDIFTREQLSLFDILTARISEHLHQPLMMHALNSAGIERFPEAQYHMVRLGIGLHGIGSSDNLIPVATYKTSVSQLKKVMKGESVGYSRSQVLERDTLVATIPVGYADGMDRRMGKGNGLVWIQGKLVPTLGNICMDMTMVDVTGMDVKQGTEVEIFGKNLPVSVLAQRIGTIPYEILTSIPERVKRVYLQE